MSDNSADLLRRIEAIETRLDVLTENIAGLSKDVPAKAPPDRISVIQPPKKSKQARIKLKDQPLFVGLTAENIFKWAGIILVLLSVAFFFKYAIDQGWLFPVVRVGIGVLFGLALVGTGLLIHKNRPGFGQVLQGGAVVTFYLSVLAASELCGLLPYPVAFGCMLLVTILALVLGVYQRDPGLSILGLSGGLATPFLLATTTSSVSVLISYTCLLLLAAAVVYFYWGWRSFLASSALGGWIVFIVASDAVQSQVSPPVSDNIALQTGFVFALLAFWAVPLWRDWLAQRRPDVWTAPWRMPERPWTRRLETHELRHLLHLLVVVTPFLVVLLSGILWDFDKTSWAVLCLIAALAMCGIAVTLHRTGAVFLAESHGISALAICATGIIASVQSETTLALLALEGTAIHILASRLSSRPFSIVGHAVWIVPGFWMVISTIGDTGPDRPLVALVGTIAVAVLSSFFFRQYPTRWLYRGVAFVAWLGWLHIALGGMEGGQGLVTVAWAATGIAALILGIRSDIEPLRTIGFATLGLVIGKLFLFDLSRLELIWRIFLFLGVGLTMLVLGYVMPSLWKPLLKKSNSEDTNRVQE